MDTIQAFKGFDKDWKCREYQFALGKSYEHSGKVSLCETGFHAVEFPLDALTYYKPGDGSKYAKVTLGGVTDEKKGDSKRVGSKIAIDAKVSILDMIKAQVKLVLERADKKSVATGYSGHAAATGDSGHAAATGDSGHAAATGNYGTSVVGFNGKAKAGATGSFAIAWFDEKAKRARLIVGTPGENGIKADTWYAAKDGVLVEAAV